MACAFTSLKLVDVRPWFKCSSLMPAGSNVSAGSFIEQELLQKPDRNWCHSLQETKEQQHSNGSAAISRGREAHGELQSVPEQTEFMGIVSLCSLPLSLWLWSGFARANPWRQARGQHGGMLGRLALWMVFAVSTQARSRIWGVIKIFSHLRLLCAFPNTSLHLWCLSAASTISSPGDTGLYTLPGGSSVRRGNG